MVSAFSAHDDAAFPGDGGCAFAGDCKNPWVKLGVPTSIVAVSKLKEYFLSMIDLLHDVWIS